MDFNVGYMGLNLSLKNKASVRCARSTKCGTIGWAWNEEENTCIKTTACAEKPEHSVWNGDSAYISTYSDGTWSTVATEHSEEAGSCHFKCEEKLVWTGTSCDIPECSATSATPCYDSATHLTWSDESVGRYLEAVSKCEDLTDGGFTEWRLPNIDEVRTLLKVERASACKVSEINDCLSYNNCWTCETCTEEGVADTENSNLCQSFGEFYFDGRYSDFADTSYWSSSIVSDDPDFVWKVDFYRGSVEKIITDDTKAIMFRCVRGQYNP
ncbi:DUF1566 domain-containing protein [bacterium]|nr:DUF1566 domain-containing protein [bacterium]